MDAGRFVLHRFNGDEVYQLRSATIRTLTREDGLRLWFEVETEKEALQRLPDTDSEYRNPKAEIDVPCVDSTNLVGRRFTLPLGNEDELNATFYYFEHQILDNNEIENLDQQGNVFFVRWTATTTDVDYYDGSKPDTRIEVEGYFTFEEMSGEIG